MKRVHLTILLVVLSSLFMGCEDDKLTPTPPPPRGSMAFNGEATPINMAFKSTEFNVNIALDSTAGYLHDFTQYVFAENLVTQDTVTLAAPGTGIIYFSVYTPAGQALAPGTYFSAKNRSCSATEASQTVFCELFYSKDQDGDLSIGAGESVLVTEGILEVTGTGDEQAMSFAGTGQGGVGKVTFTYEGQVEKLSGSFITF